MKQKFELEYIISSSPKVLFERLSTADGLSEWFADDVNQKGNVFSFFWDESEQQAELLSKKNEKYIRFHWLDDEDEDAYFEFKIEIDELTKDLALIITDFADEDEQEDAIELWDKQIEELQHALGA
jgi:uncharacterized protein YndB with AHSA1/START domain